MDPLADLESRLWKRVADIDTRLARAETGEVVKPSGVRVTRTANQTITTALSSPLLWDAETWDDEGYHSLVSNTDRLVAPRAGRYLCALNVRWATSSAGTTRFCGVASSTGEVVARSRQQPIGESEQSVSAEVGLQAGGYVTAAVFQDSGGDLDVQGGAFAGTNFSLRYLGPA